MVMGCSWRKCEDAMKYKVEIPMLGAWAYVEVDEDENFFSIDYQEVVPVDEIKQADTKTLDIFKEEPRARKNQR